MQLRIGISDVRGTGKRIKERIAVALNESVKEAADQIKLKGREEIKGSWPRMSPRMMNAWTTVVNPTKGELLSPSAKAYHKARYAGIFEEGRTSTIHSKRGLLWLPIPGSPASKMQRGGAGAAQRLTPAAVSFKLGRELTYIHRPGHAPLLCIKNIQPSRSGAIPKGRKGNRVKMAARKERLLTPLFFGIPSVTIIGRWNVRAIAEREWSRLDSLVKSNLK